MNEFLRKFPWLFYDSNNPIKTQNWHLSYTNFVTWLCNEVQYCDLIRSSFHIWGNVFGESWVLFLLLLCSFMCVNNRMHYGPMIVFVCLYFTLPHYHQYADVYEGTELRKYLSGTLTSVCLRLSLSFMQYVYSAYLFILSWLWEYMSFILSSSNRNRSMTHFPLFGVRSWNNGMCCMTFYILIDGFLQDCIKGL